MENRTKIVENYKKLREEIPDRVDIVVASKTRSPEEIEHVIDAGAKYIGENYVQEAEEKIAKLGRKAEKVNWHLIGHLQKNKINKALPIFDLVQSVESLYRAKHINKRVERAGKEKIPVYLEINIAREESKYGMEPNYNKIEKFFLEAADLDRIEIQGIMTMGRRTGDPESMREDFKKTRDLYEKAKEIDTPNSNLKTLSMGMTNSYRVAIEEGSNMVRIGTGIFGKREYEK